MTELNTSLLDESNNWAIKKTQLCYCYMNSHCKLLLLTVISSATEWSTKTISAVTPIVSSMNVTRCIIKTKVFFTVFIH